MARSLVTLDWTGEDLVFDGVSDHGSVRLAGGVEGEADAPTPSEALLLALGGCTAMDVVSILRTMRQPLRALRVEVAGERAPDHPHRYVSIEVVYRLEGDLDEARVRRAIELSEQKYCSVEATLRDGVSISSRCVIERSEPGSGVPA